MGKHTPETLEKLEKLRRMRYKPDRIFYPATEVEKWNGLRSSSMNSFLRRNRLLHLCPLRRQPGNRRCERFIPQEIIDYYDSLTGNASRVAKVPKGHIPAYAALDLLGKGDKTNSLLTRLVNSGRVRAVQNKGIRYYNVEDLQQHLYRTKDRPRTYEVVLRDVNPKYSSNMVRWFKRRGIPVEKRWAPRGKQGNVYEVSVVHEKYVELYYEAYPHRRFKKAA